MYLLTAKHVPTLVKSQCYKHKKKDFKNVQSQQYNLNDVVLVALLLTE